MLPRCPVFGFPSARCGSVGVQDVLQIPSGFVVAAAGATTVHARPSLSCALSVMAAAGTCVSATAPHVATTTVSDAVWRLQ